MKINVSDMLVFEAENGSIYQDCVDSINNCDVKKYNRSVVFTNCFRLVVDVSTNSVIDIYGNGDYEDVASTLKLKEIWTRTDEDTYKKVWG